MVAELLLYIFVTSFSMSRLASCGNLGQGQDAGSHNSELYNNRAMRPTSGSWGAAYCSPHFLGGPKKH